ncbi:MAG: hypothetical protein AAGJ46_16610 [Planctomycetota bacterium]
MQLIAHNRPAAFTRSFATHGATNLFASLLAADGFACRFNVRDTAFVDLGHRPYGLVWSGDETDSSPTDEEIAKLQAVLRSTNLRAKAAPAGNQSPLGWSLVASVGLRLPLEGEPDVDAMLQETTALAERCLDAHTLLLLLEGTDEQANRSARATLEETIDRVVASSALRPTAIAVGRPS